MSWVVQNPRAPMPRRSRQWIPIIHERIPGTHFLFENSATHGIRSGEHALRCQCR